MNVEFRIAKLERLLSNVCERRAQDRLSLPKQPGQTRVAAWDRLERDFRIALGSLKQRGLEVRSCA